MEQKELNFGFWVGVFFAGAGIIFNLWYFGLFGLIVMITMRWIEKEKDEKEEPRKK